MVEMSYGPWPPGDSIMTLLDADTGLNVSFLVTEAKIDMGAEAFDARIFTPAMVALDRRRHAGVFDFPTISLKPQAPSIDG